MGLEHFGVSKSLGTFSLGVVDKRRKINFCFDLVLSSERMVYSQTPKLRGDRSKMIPT